MLFRKPTSSGVKPERRLSSTLVKIFGIFAAIAWPSGVSASRTARRSSLLRTRVSRPRFSSRSISRVTALASMPYSRASSAASTHLPLATMNRMLPCWLVMPSSAMLRWVTMFDMVDFTRASR